MTAQRGKNCGLVDEIGDFKDALESVAKVGDSPVRENLNVELGS